MTSPKLALVVARAENGVIGRGGDLPWRMKSDLQWFKANTLGKPVVMGRKTFESIGRPLPRRTNIVITRQTDYHPEGIKVVGGLNEAIALARDDAAVSGADEIAVIGGGEIYKATLPLADILYLTTIEADIEGDTLFPSLAGDEWTIETAGRIENDADNDHNARLEIWRR